MRSPTIPLQQARAQTIGDGSDNYLVYLVKYLSIDGQKLKANEHIRNTQAGMVYICVVRCNVTANNAKKNSETIVVLP